jgi:hypothetical protein
MGDGDQFVSRVDLLQRHHRLVPFLFVRVVSSTAAVGRVRQLVEHRSMCQCRSVASIAVELNLSCLSQKRC